MIGDDYGDDVGEGIEDGTVFGESEGYPVASGATQRSNGGSLVALTWGANRQPDRAKHGWWLLTACLLGGAFRILHLEQASLWNDELFSRYYPELGLNFIWGEGFTLETTPPVYYTMLLGWMRLFGTSEAAVRSLSVVGSVATIPLVYLLSREFPGRESPLWAAFLFAIEPMQVFYGQEARVYSLASLPICLVLLGMARFLREARLRHLVLYAIGGTMSVYLHNTAAIFLVSCNLAFLTTLVGRWSAISWRAVRAWVAVNAVVAVLCVPEAVAMIRELQDDSLSWTGPSTWRDITSAVGDLISGPAIYPLRLNLGLGLMFCLTVAWGIWIVRPDRRTVTVLMLIPCFDFALILLAGVQQPILTNRILCWMGVPLSVLLGCILSSATRARPALIIGMGAALVVGLGFQITQGATVKEPWRSFLAQLQPEIAKADLVVVGPWTLPTAFLYYGKLTDKIRHWDEHLPLAVEQVVSDRFAGKRDISRDTLLAAIREGQRVLLIQREVEFHFLNRLTEVFPPQQVWQADCGRPICMKVVYWDRRATDLW